MGRIGFTEEAISKAVNVSDNLDKELRELPSHIWHYGSLSAAAAQAASENKAALEHTRAQVWGEVRRASDGKKPAPTVDDVTAMVEGDMRVVQSRTRYTQSEADRATLAASVNALLAKRDMLVQISATKTAELRAGLSDSAPAPRKR